MNRKLIFIVVSSFLLLIVFWVLFNSSSSKVDVRYTIGEPEKWSVDTMSNKIYEIVTERIIQELERGNVPWRKPWSAAWAPKNGFSRHDYRGIN